MAGKSVPDPRRDAGPARTRRLIRARLSPEAPSPDCAASESTLTCGSPVGIRKTPDPAAHVRSLQLRFIAVTAIMKRAQVIVIAHKRSLSTRFVDNSVHASRIALRRAHATVLAVTLAKKAPNLTFR